MRGGGEPLSVGAADPKPSPGRAPWGLVDIVLAIATVIGLTLLLMLPVGVAIAFSDRGGDGLSTEALLALGYLQEIVMAGTAVLFSIGRHHGRWADLGLRLPKQGGLWIPVVTFLGAGTIMFLYLAFLEVVGYGDVEGNVPSDFFDSVAMAVAAGALLVGLAPVMEEIFFRGFLFGGLWGRWGFMWAAGASGLIFALFHINPVIYVPIAGIGFLFAWSYAYTGSLLTSIAAHLAYNSFVYALAVSGVAE